MGLANYLDKNGFHSFEGERGIERLNAVLAHIDYRDSGFAHGSPVEVFLQDNPGAIDKLLEFIEEYFDADFDVMTSEETIDEEYDDECRDIEDEDEDEERLTDRATLRITGSYGYFDVDESGTILHRHTVDSESGSMSYDNIDRFDVAEYRFYDLTAMYTDISLIGYWNKDDSYSKPSIEYRKQLDLDGLLKKIM